MRTISMAREACQWHVLNRLCRGRSGLLFESVIAPGDLSVLREKGSGLRTPSGSRGAVLSSLLAHFRAWLPATPTGRRDRYHVAIGPQLTDGYSDKPRASLQTQLFHCSGIRNVKRVSSSELEVQCLQSRSVISPHGSKIRAFQFDQVSG